MTYQQTFVPEDRDSAIDGVYLSATNSGSRVFFDPEALLYIRAGMPVPIDEDRAIYFKMVADHPGHYVFQPSTVGKGRGSGFYRPSLTGNTFNMQFDCRPDEHQYGKTPAHAYFRPADTVAASRLFVEKPRPDTRVIAANRSPSKAAPPPEPVKVTVFVPPVPEREFTPKAMQSVVPTPLSGFTRISKPVLYRCSRTGEELAFDSEQQAQAELGRRADAIAFCDRHQLKFDPCSAFCRALMTDEKIHFL